MEILQLQIHSVWFTLFSCFSIYHICSLLKHSTLSTNRKHCCWECRKINHRRNGHQSTPLNCGTLEVIDASMAALWWMQSSPSQSSTRSAWSGSRVVTLCFMGLGMMDHNCHGQQLFIEWIHQPRSSSVLMGMLMDFKAFVVSICGFVNFPWPSWPIHFCIGCFAIRKKWKKLVRICHPSLQTADGVKCVSSFSR